MQPHSRDEAKNPNQILSVENKTFQPQTPISKALCCHDWALCYVRRRWHHSSDSCEAVQLRLYTLQLLTRDKTDVFTVRVCLLVDLMDRRCLTWCVCGICSCLSHSGPECGTSKCFNDLKKYFTVLLSTITVNHEKMQPKNFATCTTIFGKPAQNLSFYAATVPPEKAKKLEAK